MEHLVQHIESLIFTCEQPIRLEEIKSALQEAFDTKMKKAEIEQALDLLMQKYQSEEYSMEVVKIAGGYQFLTKGAFHNTVGTHLKQTMKKRLSRAALETLAVIAYKQPTTKVELEKIRGVNCDYAVQKLLEKELITLVGRAEGPGRPLLFSTSQKFMDYFGLKDISDLPKLKEFQNPENTIGEAAPIEEAIPHDNIDKASSDDIIDIAIALSFLVDPPSSESEETANSEEISTEFIQSTSGEFTEPTEIEANTENPEDVESVVINDNEIHAE